MAQLLLNYAKLHIRQYPENGVLLIADIAKYRAGRHWASRLSAKTLSLCWSVKSAHHMNSMNNVKLQTRDIIVSGAQYSTFLTSMVFITPAVSNASRRLGTNAKNTSWFSFGRTLRRSVFHLHIPKNWHSGRLNKLWIKAYLSFRNKRPEKLLTSHSL